MASGDLFPSPTSSDEPAVAYCDGGARGNPGPAGYGAVIHDSSGAVLAELSEFLGFRTNNYAEYSGLLAVLQWALDQGLTKLRVISDSELMVKQIQGRYKVNSPDLRPLYEEARRRIARLDSFQIAHALRHKNKAADRLANEAMDRGMGKTAATTPRATPYPVASEAPRPPRQMDPAPKKVAAAGRASELSAAPSEAEPPMLRGFVRDGVVHLLGSHTLPDGIFVKVVRE